MQLLGTILLLVQIGDLHVKAWFGIVEILSVDVLLGTPFTDQFIRKIFPAERSFVPRH